MPPLSITYRDERFVVVPKPQLAIAGVIPWCVRVAGGWYQVATDPAAAIDGLPRFIRERLRPNWSSRAPFLLAGRKTPLIFKIGGAVIRAYASFVPRGRGATTYVNPATGDRVATTRGPVWVFETEGRPFSWTDAGALRSSASSEQTIADVVDLAKMWLPSEL